MRTPHLKIVTMIAGLTLTGCVHAGADERNLTASTYYGTQLFFNDTACELSGYTPPADMKTAISIGQTSTTKPTKGQELAAIGATLITAILPTLIDKGLDFASAFLKKQKENLTGSASANSYVISNNDKSGFLGCLTFIRGTFGTPVAAGNYTSFGLAEAPDFAVEFAYVRPFSNKAATYLQPVQVEFRNTVAKRGDDKQVLLTVSLTAPTVKASSGAMPPPPGGVKKDEEKESKPNLASFVLGFNQLKKGSVITAPALRGMRTDLAEFTGGFPDYANVSITAIETETGGDLFVAAAEVVEENKSKISPVLLEQLKKLLKIKDEE